MRRHLTTILAADIAGFSRLIGADEEGVLAARRAHRAELIDPLLEQHHGRVANTAGDSLLIDFPSVVEAVRFALAMQDGMASRNTGIPQDRRIEYRIGVNVGDVVAEGQDLLGDGVNVAARLEAMAAPGGIILSRAARDQVRDRVDLDLVDLGEVAVKNIARPVRAFQVLRDGETPLRKPRPASRRLRSLTVTLIVLLALIGAGVFGLVQRRDFTPVDPASMAYALPEKPSIAVLPFENRSADQSLGWIGDGLTESIISTLSLSPDMVVIARATSFSYKGRVVTVEQVARELGVRYVLSGSAQSDGTRLRVTAELADAVEGRQIWSLREDRMLDDVFLVQDQIAEKLFEEMQVTLTIGEAARQWKALSGDLEGWSHMIRGRAEFQKFSPEGHQAAARIWGWFPESRPDLAIGYFLMGWVHWQKILLGLSKDPDADMAEARRLSERALSIQEFGDGYTLAAVLALFSGQHDLAIAHADKALELAPGGGDTHSLGGFVKAASGQVTEGLALMLRSMRLEPDFPDWLPGSVVLAQLELGQIEDAKAFARAVLAADVEDVRAKPRAQAALVAAAVFEGKNEDAVKAARRLLEIAPATTLGQLRQRLGFYKNQAFVERYLDALRQAGIS